MVVRDGARRGACLRVVAVTIFVVTRPDFTEETAQTVCCFLLQSGPRRVTFGDEASAGALKYGRHDDVGLERLRKEECARALLAKADTLERIYFRMQFNRDYNLKGW
jgi:hypothetical protein